MMSRFITTLYTFNMLVRREVTGAPVHRRVTIHDSYNYIINVKSLYFTQRKYIKNKPICKFIKYDGAFSYIYTNGY